MLIIPYIVTYQYTDINISGSCWGNRRDGDLDVDGWIILGWISRWVYGLDWDGPR